KTSLTMRLRFTPAIVCSTRTRVVASWRLARFSAPVRSRPGGFFFRLAGLADRRLIALKPGVLVQRGTGWIRQPCLVSDPLLMGATGVGAAQEQHALIRGAGHQHALVGVRLLLAA